MGNIDRTTFQQYRTIQREGHCNMLDQSCVRDVAESLGFEELAEVIDDDDYHIIIENYESLKEEFADA